MECTIAGIGIAQVGVISLGIGMILFALFLGIGCILGIRQEQKEAEQNQLTIFPLP